MKILPLTWHKVHVKPTDSRDDITRKLGECGIMQSGFSNSTYVIRLSNTFIVEYERQQCSPVVYIGEGHIRARLYKHLGWITKLGELLPGTKIEARVCFPQTTTGQRANEEFEAYLLRSFLKRYGSFPLRNRVHGIANESIDFSDEKTAQIIGHGTGNKFTWNIRPRPSKVPFVKEKSR